MFRLRPKNGTPKPSVSRLDDALAEPIVEVPVEEQWTEKVFVEPSREVYEAERREQRLVLALRDHLLRKGHEVHRLKIVPPGEAKPIFSDLVDRRRALRSLSQQSRGRIYVRSSILLASPLSGRRSAAFGTRLGASSRSRSSRKVEMRVAEHYNLEFEQAELDFVNVDVYGDDLLYVDRARSVALVGGAHRTQPRWYASIPLRAAPTIYLLHRSVAGHECFDTR